MSKLITCKSLCLLSIFGLLLAPTLQARPNISVKNTLTRAENPRGDTRNSLIMPYAFSSESMGFTFGVGGGTKGYGQEQLLLGATAFYGADEAVGLFLGMWDFRPSFANRFFFGAQGMVGHYPKNRAYSSVTFQPDSVRAGSNDSHMDDYAEDSGYDNWTDFKMEFVLPWGSARNDSMQHYTLKNGLLQSAPVGGDTWNPMENGVTTLLLRQYNRYRSFEFNNGDRAATIHPLQFAISYNNTDFPGNPSTGSEQYFGITHDFGWLESNYDWTFVEFEASKYFSLGSSAWARQRIVALNLWTGDSPSWDEQTNPDGSISVSNRPPFYEGSTLGGFYRMRAYPIDRFNDRSVIYTAAEYRYTLDWNPIGNISWLRFLKSDWLQLVAFAEAGRVANDFGSDLFKEWKVDGGMGLRAMFSGAVVRLDVGVSEETTSAWVMFGHPF
ncbi:MAG: BamA/TamA family outer membrane protein [Thermodesulfobacteriota bacterium]